MGWSTTSSLRSRVSGHCLSSRETRHSHTKAKLSTSSGSGSSSACDTATGSHLWADRFDGLLDDIFDLQDKVTQQVVGAIAPEVDRAEMERASRKPAGNIDA